MTIKDIMEQMDYGPSSEANSDVTSWLAARGAAFGHFINGAFEAADDASIAVENPATGEVLAHVVEGDAAAVDRAVQAARAAFPAWQALSGTERGRYLYAIARQLQKRERFFAVLESMDNGKPIKETKGADVPLAIRHFYHHAGWASALAQEFPDQQALGVCGQIIPWNFPLLMLAWKIAPALAAGNTVVLKPADLTPLSAIAFAELLGDIGLPAGVVNIVHGGAATGQAIVAHPDIDKIAFTGSTAVGREIRRATAGSGKRITLELGGKSPFIVCADADLDAAVEGVVDGVWFNQGEVCCAGSRLLLQEGIAEAFTAKLRKRLETIRLGDPLDKSTDMGAIVSAKQKARIEGLLAGALREGYGIEQSRCALPVRGHFVAPGFVVDAEPAATISQTEVFGPIAVTMAFRSIDEAVSLANNTAYGLAASVWSENINTATDLAARMKAGVVWINGSNMFDANAPFGGVKESGFGREGARVGMGAYLRPKAKAAAKVMAARFDFTASTGQGHADVAIDQTQKNYIGGKQQRPDGGASFTARFADGTVAGLAPLSGRKDIRNALEAALKAKSWAANAHLRAQVLYYLAENFAARAEEAAGLLARMTGAKPQAAAAEVRAAIDKIFLFAGLADKLDGAVQAVKPRHLCLSTHEPLGVVGVIAPDDAPLLGLISLLMPLVAAGNAVVAVPSPRLGPLVALIYQLLDTSDMPAGVINLVTGDATALAPTLAEHDALDGLWAVTAPDLQRQIETKGADNLKQIWANDGVSPDWAQENALDWLRRASQCKTIWLPYGA